MTKQAKIGNAVVQFVYDLMQREYPIFRTVTTNLRTQAGVHEYDLKEIAELRDKVIYGLSIRQQIQSDANYSATNIRRDHDGYPLLNNQALDAAFLSLQRANTTEIEQIPLANFVHERGVINPGWFAQLFILPGFSDRSHVHFSGVGSVPATGAGSVLPGVAAPTPIVDNESIELTWYYMPREICNQVNLP